MDLSNKKARKNQVNHFFIIKSYLDLTHKFLSINYNLPYCIENTPFISLNDYIASISFDTDEVKCFYPPVGKIPKECIDFTVIDEVLIPKRSFVYSELMILTVALATLSTLDF